MTWEPQGYVLLLGGHPLWPIKPVIWISLSAFSTGANLLKRSWHISRDRQLPNQQSWITRSPLWSGFAGNHPFPFYGITLACPQWKTACGGVKKFLKPG